VRCTESTCGPLLAFSVLRTFSVMNIQHDIPSVILQQSLSGLSAAAAVLMTIEPVDPLSASLNEIISVRQFRPSPF